MKIAGWLVFSLLVVWYFIFSYEKENEGAGWNFIVYAHPLYICPLVFLFYRFVGMLIRKFTSSSTQDAQIKFKGIRTTAKVIKVKETGTYINEQPMIQFELAYTDEQHQTHRRSINKLIGLLNLDMTKQENADIFYMKEDPTQIAFATDLDKMTIPGHD